MKIPHEFASIFRKKSACFPHRPFLPIFHSSAHVLFSASDKSTPDNTCNIRFSRKIFPSDKVITYLESWTFWFSLRLNFSFFFFRPWRYTQKLRVSQCDRVNSIEFMQMKKIKGSHLVIAERFPLCQLVWVT